MKLLVYYKHLVWFRIGIGYIIIICEIIMIVKLEYVIG